MDLTRELRNLVSTGVVHFGYEQARKAAIDKKAKLIIIADNCKKENTETIKGFEGVRTFDFEGTNFELGAACGKPFSISMLTVMNEGESNILDLV